MCPQVRTRLSDGYLVYCLDRILWFWVDFLGIWAWAFLRPKEEIGEPVITCVKRRDVVIVGKTILAFVWMCLWDVDLSRFWKAVLLGLALFACVDLIMALLRAGIFGGVRTVVPLASLPESRLSRVLIGLLLNYAELLALFALIHAWLSWYDPDQFKPQIPSTAQAFYVSMTTMTTLGYGEYSAAKPLALGLTALQAGIGLFIIAVVIGRIIGLVMVIKGAHERDKDSRMESRPTGRFIAPWLWVGPFVVIIGFITFAYCVLLDK